MHAWMHACMDVCIEAACSVFESRVIRANLRHVWYLGSIGVAAAPQHSSCWQPLHWWIHQASIWGTPTPSIWMGFSPATSPRWWDRPWLNGPFFIGKVDVLRPDFFHGRTNGIQWDIGYPSLRPTKSSLLCCVHWLTCVCPPRNCSLSSYERIRSLRSIILLLAFKSQMTLNMTLQDTHQCHQSNIYIAAAGPATFQGNQENHSSSTPFSLQS